jgi:methylthioribose-1-phosphate isomerase
VHVTPLRWERDTLFLLDQRRLPLEETWVACRSSAEVAEAIRTMVVRGAPAIGVCAAFGIALAAVAGEELAAAGAALKNSRPTAVNLGWAVDRMLAAAAAAPGGDLSSLLTAEAEAILREDGAANRQIGRYGAALLGQSVTILTHCNAGALATGGYGTALGVVRAAVESGRTVAVFADETRPYLQGARLTAWELQRDGIDVTLITDNMAGHFFQKSTFDAVIVGADRIAANGDTANKIGTYTVAVLAKAHGIPFYVAAPISTIDPECPSGAAIPIEERSADEVTGTGAARIAPEGIGVRHPAFDVTPAHLISAIITEKGVLRPPYEVSILEAFERN